MTYYYTSACDVLFIDLDELLIFASLADTQVSLLRTQYP